MRRALILSAWFLLVWVTPRPAFGFAEEASAPVAAAPQLTAVAVTETAAAVPTDVTFATFEKRPTLFWLAAGAGFDTLVGAKPFPLAGAEAALMKNDHLFALRAYAVGQTRTLLKKRDIRTHLYVADLMYGRGAHTELGAGFLHAAVLTLSAGPSFVRVDHEPNSEDCTRKTRHCIRNTGGLALQIENVYVPSKMLPFLGLAFTATANINPLRPWSGVLLQVVAGKLD